MLTTGVRGSVPQTVPGKCAGNPQWRVEWVATGVLVTNGLYHGQVLTGVANERVDEVTSWVAALQGRRGLGLTCDCSGVIGQVSWLLVFCLEVPKVT